MSIKISDYKYVTVFDWSMNRGLTTTHDWGESVDIYNDFNHLLKSDKLKSGNLIVCESTSGSYELDLPMFSNDCNRLGHTLVTVSTRQTPRWLEKLFPVERDEYGRKLRKKNSVEADKNDLLAICEEIKHPDSLKLVKQIDLTDIYFTKFQLANSEIMLMRRSSGGAIIGPNGGRYPVNKKYLWSKKIMDFLPLELGLNPVMHACLWNDNENEYKDTLVAAVGLCAKYCRNEKEFDRMSGLYVHGYPCQIRSDLYHWTWKPLIGQVSLSDFRKSCRWLFRKIKSILNQNKSLLNTNVDLNRYVELNYLKYKRQMQFLEI